MWYVNIVVIVVKGVMWYVNIVVIIVKGVFVCFSITFINRHLLTCA